jgi:ABC-type Zn uptake system ZnuABC Zn-binding protein ZnuA
VLRLLSTLIISVFFWLGEEARAQDKPVIVTSFTVIQDWVQVIGGKEFKIINLIPPRSEAHGYQLSPRDAKELRQASLIVAMHPDLEPWLAAWGKANHKSESILWLCPEEAAKEKKYLGRNPHAWTCAPDVREMTRVIAAKLTEIRPHCDAQNSYNQYVKVIEQVDAELALLFKGLKADQRTFISQHPNLGPFADHYGLNVADTILTNGAAESADPSVHHFSSLLALIRKQKIRVIVTDAGQNDAFARRLTEDAGIPPPLPLTFEYLEPAGQPGDTWASMMLLNGRRLHQALSRR